MHTLLKLLFLVQLALAAHPQIGAVCSTNKDCSTDGFTQCKSGTCQQKDLWPINELEFWGFIFLFFYLVVANTGGVGGAGVQIPILVVFMKMSAKNAVPLGNFSIFLSSFIRYFVNSKRPHPLKNGKGTLVDYDLAIIMIPLIICGSSFGALFNNLLPTIYINISYIILMMMTNCLGVFNLCNVRKKENAAFKKKNEEAEQTQNNQVLNLSDGEHGSEGRDEQKFIEHNEIEQSKQAAVPNLHQDLDDDKENSRATGGNNDEAAAANGTDRPLLVAPKEVEMTEQVKNTPKASSGASPRATPEAALEEEKVQTLQLGVQQKSEKKQIIQVGQHGGEDEGLHPDHHTVMTDQDELEGGEENDSKLQKREAISERENTNFQWKKVILNWSMIIILIVISYLRGNGKTSPVDIIRCSGTDWFMFALLQIIAIIVFIIGVYIVKQEYVEKVACDFKFVDGDLEATPKNILKMSCAAFFGSMGTAFCGIGPGAAFVPLLIALGFHPIIASSTGMYLTTFTTLSASIEYIIQGKMLYDYAVYAQIMTFGATFIGIFFQFYIFQKTGRTTPLICMLQFCGMSSTIAYFVFVLPRVLHKVDMGLNLFKIPGYCPK